MASQNSKRSEIAFIVSGYEKEEPHFEGVVETGGQLKKSVGATSSYLPFLYSILPLPDLSFAPSFPFCSFEMVTFEIYFSFLKTF